MTYSFRNDYSEGAHPRIVEALCSTNLEQTIGYGNDPHCQNAQKLIRQATACPDGDVHFLVGGTQANLTVITAALRPHQAVIAADCGHVNVHETGAIEATGHKVLAMPAQNGKLTPGQILAALAHHTDEHMVQPKLVYLSHPSEIGTLYTKAELLAIRKLCNQYGLFMFVDGARLASGLMAQGSDVTLRDLGALADVFYLGGTKCGALFGEAVVLVNPALKADFRYLIKQRGGMLAKGRLLGVQFEELFRDDLYLQLGAHANEMAMRLKAGFAEQGTTFLTNSFTNQQFPTLPNAVVKALEQDYIFETWEKTDDAHTTVRFVTSWATPPKAVECFLADYRRACKQAQ